MFLSEDDVFRKIGIIGYFKYHIYETAHLGAHLHNLMKG